MTSLQNENNSSDPRNLVLLKGYRLKEKPVSPLSERCAILNNTPNPLPNAAQNIPINQLHMNGENQTNLLRDQQGSLQNQDQPFNLSHQLLHQQRLFKTANAVDNQTSSGNSNSTLISQLAIPPHTNPKEGLFFTQFPIFNYKLKLQYCDFIERKNLIKVSKLLGSLPNVNSQQNTLSYPIMNREQQLMPPPPIPRKYGKLKLYFIFGK